MDPFDIKLLAALQQDGRLTSQELAERVGLSPSQCARRRVALEESGAIRSYHAQLSAEALGLELTAYVLLSLAAHSRDAAKGVAALLDSLEEVQEAYALTGEADYLLKVVTPDLKTLSRVLNDKLLPHPGVAHVRSSIVLDHLKQTAALPLSHLL